MLPIITSHAGDIELFPDPVPKDWVLDGCPEARAHRIARSSDDGMWITVWACSRGTFRWHYNVDETAHILSGEVLIIDDSGTERRLRAGDTAFFPAGTSVVWHVTREVRKLAVCRVPVPKPVVAGSKLWGRIRNRLRRTSFATARCAPPAVVGENSPSLTSGSSILCE